MALIATYNLYEMYVYMFFLGATFAGRIVVGLNYALEFNRLELRSPFLLAFFLVEALSIICLTLWYQFVDRSYWLLQVFALIGKYLTILYLVILMPESPRWSYTVGNFKEANSTIQYVARFNDGMPKRVMGKLD